MPPAGTAAGAVYVVVGLVEQAIPAPVSHVWVGLSVPQAPGLPQVTVQSAPALVTSFVRAAPMVVEKPLTSKVVGAPVMFIEIGGPKTVAVAVAVTLALAVAVAVILIVAALIGAVNVVV